MGTVYKRLSTKPIPQGATVTKKGGKRIARWTGRDGAVRTAEIKKRDDGTEYILLPSKVFFARYRDGRGIVREETTGCREEAGARRILSEMERRAELVRSGLLEQTEDDAAGWQTVALARHVDEYIEHLKAQGNHKGRIRDTRKRLELISQDLGWAKLSDLRGERVERWLVDREKGGMGPATWNEHRTVLVGFASWCVRRGRLIENPFLSVPRRDPEQDRRRRRRALTEDEIPRLLDAARRRPVRELKLIHRGEDTGKEKANVREGVLRSAEVLGHERALIYKLLITTGLRRGELESVTIGDLRLDAASPHLVLGARHAKNRKEARVPLRADVVTDIREWLRMSPKASLEAPLVRVPKALAKILDRDLALAKIPKKDAHGRTVDVHSGDHPVFDGRIRTYDDERPAS